MEVTWNFWTFLFMVIASQGVLLSALIFRSKPAYKYFAMATGLFSLLLFYYLAFWTGNITALPRWTGILMGIPYLLAPLVYRQVRNIVLWRHMLFFVLYVSFILAAQIAQFPAWIFFFQAAFQCVFLLVYASLSIQSATTTTDRIIGLLFLGYSIAHMTYYILNWTGLLTPLQDYFVSLAGAAFIYGGAYVIIFRKKRPVQSDALHSKMRNILIERIEEEKLYLDNELRLQSLSEATGFSVHQISELINSGGKSFADLINGYRVREAKRMLESLEYEEMSTTQIGYEAGFNNKSSFFRHFRNVTGESPMQFRNRRKIVHSAKK